jgi:hypothetical protein
MLAAMKRDRKIRGRRAFRELGVSIAFYGKLDLLAVLVQNHAPSHVSSGEEPAELRRLQRGRPGHAETQAHQQRHDRPRSAMKGKTDTTTDPYHHGALPWHLLRK